MSFHYSLAQIEAFASVYECGNFTRAARKLQKDRTTVSELVENLELDLGYSLFCRTTRPLQLTSQGQLLYRQARLFLLEAQAFGQIAVSLEQPSLQTLTLSYDVFTPRHTLLRLAGKLSQHGIRLNLLCQSRQSAETGLLTHTIDIGIYPAKNQSVSENFKWRAIGTMAVAVYAHRACFPSQLVSLLALAAGNQLIPYEGMPAGLAQWMLIADRVQIVSEQSMLLALLSEKQGWALLPEHWQADQHADVTRIETEMGNAGLTHPLVILWQPGEKAHPALMTAIEVITAVFEEENVILPHRQGQ